MANPRTFEELFPAEIWQSIFKKVVSDDDKKNMRLLSKSACVLFTSASIWKQKLIREHGIQETTLDQFIQTTGANPNLVYRSAYFNLTYIKRSNLISKHLAIFLMYQCDTNEAQLALLAAVTGNKDDFLNTVPKKFHNKIFVELALFANNTELALELFFKIWHNFPVSGKTIRKAHSDMFELAIIAGDLKAIKALLDNNRVTLQEAHLKLARQYQRDDIYDFIKNKLNCADVIVPIEQIPFPYAITHHELEKLVMGQTAGLIPQAYENGMDSFIDEIWSVAISQGNLIIVQSLLQKNAPLTATHEHLYLAISSGNVELVKFLLQQFPSLKNDVNHDTLLHARASGNYFMVAFIVDPTQGFNINITEQDITIDQVMNVITNYDFTGAINVPLIKEYNRQHGIDDQTELEESISIASLKLR